MHPCFSGTFITSVIEMTIMQKEEDHPQRIPIKELNNNPMLSIALDTIEKGKQALVFAGTKASAEKCAETIAAKLKDDQKMIQVSEKALSFTSKPTKQCQRLARCLRRGVAFHHSGLVPGQRDLVESGFKSNDIKVICCTPTLAAGVDIPAFRTIIKDLRIFSGGWGQSWIPVLEYEQMSGRAGRPGKEDFGESIIIAASDGEFDEMLGRYIYGEPEKIYSKLAAEPVLRTYLLSLIVSGVVRTMPQIFSFFERTFWAHQYGDMNRLKQIILKVLALLEEYEFVRTDADLEQKSDFASASDLYEKEKEGDGDLVKATLLGRRVSQLYIDPLTANYIISGIRKTAKTSCSDYSYLQLVANTLEMRPILKVKVKEYDEILGKLAEHETSLLSLPPSMYEPEFEEFLGSIKTALLLHEWIDEKDEEYLLEKYSSRPGELKVKIDNADWLLYSTAELAKLMQFHNIVSGVEKVRFRLKYGVREELLALLKLKNIGRVRARKLYANGIKDIGGVKSADLMKLVQLLGKAVALDIKSQVGEDVSKIKVKENKRKGQISLNDFT